MDEPDLTIYAREGDFDRDHAFKHMKHPELEVQVEFAAEGADLTALMQDADERAAEIAQGREHYVWRLLAEQDGERLTAEVCMYVMVPRV